jgi:hypothetical protein
MVSSDKSGCRFVVEGRTGRFDIYLEVLKEQPEILHYKTSIKPHQPAQIVGSPRDLLFGGAPKNQKVAGTIHFTQKGPASAIACASFHDPADGTLLYFQIQKDTPGWAKETNWLPAPNGPIYPLMRLYWAKTEAPSILPPGRRHLESTGNREGAIATSPGSAVCRIERDLHGDGPHHAARQQSVCLATSTTSLSSCAQSGARGFDADGGYHYKRQMRSSRS